MCIGLKVLVKTEEPTPTLKIPIIQLSNSLFFVKKFFLVVITLFRSDLFFPLNWPVLCLNKKVPTFVISWLHNWFHQTIKTTFKPTSKILTSLSPPDKSQGWFKNNKSTIPSVADAVQTTELWKSQWLVIKIL